MSESGAIGILDLLNHHGFDTNQRFKLVRHQETRFNLEDFRRRGWLDAYQAFQSRPVFHNIDAIVSFIGIRGTQARLIGIYRVLGHRPGGEGIVPPGCPYADHWLELDHYYQMQRIEGFEELENRIVIEWGPGARSWHQTPRNKEVLEILPKNSLWKPFDDYLGFTLTHGELRDLCSRPDANKEWHARLSAVSGVYLILDTLTGDQYVGSAYGSGGFWGRWQQYAQSGHGGNKHLVRLMAENPIAYPSVFSYSILQVLPSSSTEREVIRWENLYKEKLGSRAKGLNAN